MAASFNVEKMKEFLKCSLCQNTFDDIKHSPRFLDCLHTFCVQCLEQRFVDESIECPACNEKYKVNRSDISNLQVDPRREIYKRYVEVMSDRQEILCGNCKCNNVVLFCKQCSYFLCKECEKAHKVWTDFQKHSAIDIKNLKGDGSDLNVFARFSKCKVINHRNYEQKFYCTNESCCRPICAECCLAEHQSHAVISLQEHINLCQSQLKEQLEIFEKNVDQYQKERIAHTEEDEKLSNLESKLYKEIDDAFYIFIKLLQGRREYIKANMREIVESKKSVLQNAIEECDEIRKCYLHIKHFVSTMNSTGDPSCLTVTTPIVTRRLMTLNKSQLTFQSPSTTIIQFDADIFFSSMKAFVKTLGNITEFSISSEYSTIQIPKMVFQNETIDIFIQLKDASGTLLSNKINGVALDINYSDDKNTKLPVEWLEDGRYVLKWKPVVPGQYILKALIQELDLNVSSGILIVKERIDQVSQSEDGEQSEDANPKEFHITKAEECSNKEEKRGKNMKIVSTQKVTIPAKPKKRGTQKPTTQLEPGTRLEPETRLEPGTQLEPETQLEPGTRLDPETQLEPGTRLDPETQLEPGTRLDPETQLEPETQLKYSKELERGLRLTDTNVANGKKLGQIGWKPLPKIQGPDLINAWEAVGAKKPLPPLEWLNLPSSHEGKVTENTVRNSRPCTATGLIPPRQAPAEKYLPVLRRSNSDTFLKSFRHQDAIKLPVTNGEVVRFRPAVFFDVTSLHRDRCMSNDHRVLSNKEMWDIPRQLLAGKHLKNYTGSLLDLKLTRDIVVYFHFHVEYKIFRDLKASNLIFESAISSRRQIDISDSTFFRSSGWSLQLCRCIDCYDVCLFSHHDSTYVHKKISSDKAGTSQLCSFGLCINAQRRIIQLVDISRNRLLGTFIDVNISDEDVIAFGVYNPNRLDVTVTLESSGDLRKLPSGILDTV